jgi:hypothetical protein
MTDSTPAPAPSPASPSEGAPEGAPASTPAETAAAGLETLAADKTWQADWSGVNGRAAQRAAVKLKSAVTRSAFPSEPDTASTLPEKIESGLNAPDAVSQAAAEGMVPATSADDFNFVWKDAANMEIGELQNMDTLAKETALAVKANPAFARATLEAMDRQLSKPEGSYTPTTADALDRHLQTQLGDKADATLAAALATFELMPPDGKAWLQASLSKLDTNTAAWVVQRMASIHRANSV